jgi:hypothetical protein
MRHPVSWNNKSTIAGGREGIKACFSSVIILLEWICPHATSSRRRNMPKAMHIRTDHMNRQQRAIFYIFSIKDALLFLKAITFSLDAHNCLSDSSQKIEKN